MTIIEPITVNIDEEYLSNFISKLREDNQSRMKSLNNGDTWDTGFLEREYERLMHIYEELAGAAGDLYLTALAMRGKISYLQRDKNKSQIM